MKPRPFIQRPFGEVELGAQIGSLTERLGKIVGGLAVAGAVATQFEVARAGASGAVRVLSDTTRVPSPYESARLAIHHGFGEGLPLCEAARASTVTLPVVFER